MSSKDKFYFSHDSNARRDPKMIALMGKRGVLGYGMFFILIEVLREQDRYKLDISKKYILASVANELQLKTSDEANAFIEDCIDFELLESDGVHVWSNSLNARMDIYESKKKHMSNIAKKRWGNQDKKEEKSTKSTKPPKPEATINFLRDGKHWDEWLDSLLKSDEFKGIGKKVIVLERDKALDWMSSVGRKYKNYKAFFTGWLRRYNASHTSNKGDKNEMVY